MNLELSSAFNMLLTLTSFVLGFFVRELWSAVKNLRKDLDDLRVHLASNYVSNDSLKSMERRLMDEFREIKDILKNKADK